MFFLKRFVSKVYMLIYMVILMCKSDYQKDSNTRTIVIDYIPITVKMNRSMKLKDIKKIYNALYCIYSLPTKLKRAMVKFDLEFYILDLYSTKQYVEELKIGLKDIKKNIGSFTVSYDNENNIAYRKIHISLFVKKVENVLLHEIGHFVDYINENGMFDFKSEYDFLLEDIFKEEKYIFEFLGDKYDVTDASEYFAELFSLFFTDREFLKESFPKSYKYMKNYLRLVL